MRNWALICLLFASSVWGVPPAWETLFADFPFVLKTTVDVQGAIRRYPESTQEAYFRVLRRVLTKVKQYGDSLPGNHVFRWSATQGRFVPKHLQFYFSDQDSIDLHFPNEPVTRMPMIRRLGIRGAVRESDFRHCDYYILQVPLDYHLYDRRSAAPYEFAFLNLASSLAGHLYADVQAFLEIDYLLVGRGSPAAFAHYAAAGPLAISHSANFLLWLKQQPDFPNYPPEQQAELIRRIPTTLNDTIVTIATPPNDPGTAACAQAVVN